MSVVVTGGAGFIGSCLVRTLNDMGIEDIIIVDHISTSDKWKNMVNKKYTKYIPREQFLQQLDYLDGKVSHFIHMGACSATTERDFDFLYENNLEFTKAVWGFCVKNQISMINASSAATYGAGENGFDDKTDISVLKPLNGYGYSKQLFDLWERRQVLRPAQYVGFKFFNVYGPNEYYKGGMASVIFHTYNKILETGKMGLFKSYNSDYRDGEQLRDFVYVKDICKVVKFMIEHPEVSGLFNLGTGTARSFYDLAKSTFSALGMEPNISFVDMPEALQKKYQYYTQANMEKLRLVGYDEKFYTLEEGCSDYVTNYLAADYETF